MGHKIILKFIALFLGCCGFAVFSTFAHSASTSTHDVMVRIAPSDFNNLVAIAQTSASRDQPQKALDFYQQALATAGDSKTKQRVALFGIARMQVWLGNYRDAERIYRLLLVEKLGRDDYEIALAGLAKSLLYQDKVLAAYHVIPKDFNYTNPEMLLSATQATLWVGYPIATKRLLLSHQNLMNEVPPLSYLGRNFLATKRDVFFAAANHIIAPTFYMENDSDDLTIKKYNLGYSHPFTENSRTALVVGKAEYSQKIFDKIDATSIFANHTWRQNENLNYLLGVGSVNYEGQNPVLWAGEINYVPNDKFSFQVNNQQELVETVIALRRKNYANKTAVRLTYRPINSLFFSGALFSLHYSDKNNRNGFFASADYFLSNEYGVWTEFRVRGYTDSKTDTIGYFNPDSFYEASVLLKIDRRWFNNWRYYLHGGLGNQMVQPGGSSMTQYLSAGIRGTVTDNLWLNIFGGYTNSGFNNPSGYVRRYVGASLNFLI